MTQHGVYMIAPMPIDAGAPAHERLRALAARKLPEVRELIERAEAMRDWLSTASVCGCDSLDDCALCVAHDSADPPTSSHR